MRAWYPQQVTDGVNPLAGTMNAVDVTLLNLSVDLSLDQDKTVWHATASGLRGGSVIDLERLPLAYACVQSTRDENAFNDHGARGIIYKEGGGGSTQARIGAQPWFPELRQTTDPPASSWRMRLHFGGIMTSGESHPGKHHRGTDTERVRGVMSMIGHRTIPAEARSTGNFADLHVGGWGAGGTGPHIGGEGGF